MAAIRSALTTLPFDALAAASPVISAMLVTIAAVPPKLMRAGLTIVADGRRFGRGVMAGRNDSARRGNSATGMDLYLRRGCGQRPRAYLYDRARFSAPV